LIRRLQYNVFAAGDHATHFYALGGPDFIVGPDAPTAERNILGVIKRVGAQLSGQVIRMRKECHEVAEMLGGRRIHPVGMIPGGQAVAVSTSMQRRLVEITAAMLDFACLTQKIFADIVLAEKRYVDLIRSKPFSSRTYYMALVNERNQPDLYDGWLRVVDPEGIEVSRFLPAEYLSHISEHVEPWTYLKFPFLRSIGWKGFREGADSGIFRVAPLAMINASDSMQTPLAQQEREKMLQTLGGRPVHSTLAYHWARVIEMLQCCELAAEHARNDRLTDPNVRQLVQTAGGEGVGVVEAPRGILVHHYKANAQGLVERANLIVGTGNNHAAIQLSVLQAAQSLLAGGKPLSDGILNGIEMAIRAYDPCFGCATHALAGDLPLRVCVYGPDGALCQTLSRGGA
jgi:F420-non-reducing hydrogenase large subunit